MQDHLSVHLSKCHFVGNHMSRLICFGRKHEFWLRNKKKKFNYTLLSGGLDYPLNTSKQSKGVFMLIQPSLNRALSPEYLSSGFTIKRVSNQSPHLHGLARKLKFHL